VSTRPVRLRRRSTGSAALLLLTLTGYCAFAAGQSAPQATPPLISTTANGNSAAANGPTANGAAANGAAANGVGANGFPANSLPAGADDIRDIRGPKPVGLGWLGPMLAAAALLAAGGAYGAWLWNKRRQRPDVQTPFEIARDRLERARDLMHQARGREFSIEVSSTVREYIENRFGVMAAHRTTDEFLHDLLDSPDTVLAANRALLSEFLEACDLAKFGGWNLSMTAMEALLQSAQRFVAEAAPPESAKSGGNTILSAATQPPAAHSTAKQDKYDSLRAT